MADKYYRLVSLIVNVCPKPLRELFHRCAQNDPLFTAPYTAHDYMLFRQKDVGAARNIRQDQYDKIYPQNGGQTDVSDWDITLLASILKLLFVNQISQMSQTILTNMDIIRDARNNLQHAASASSVSDSDFNKYWSDIEDATLDLANDIKGSAYKEDIRKEITKAKTSNMPDLGNVLCKWYEEKTISLENEIHELRTEMKEQRDRYEKEINELKEDLKIVSENTSSTKRMLDIGSRKHTDITGRSSTRFKTVDNQQDVMQHMADKYYRLVSLIVNICPLPLRELFHRCAQNDPLFTAPYTAHNYMLFRQKDVRAARQIRRDQYDKIYPPNGQTDISDWDITLLATILKLLFVKQSSQMSQSILTNMDIIRDAWNQLRHVASTSSVSDTDFNERWSDIEYATLDLANDIKGSAYKEDIRREITKAKTSNMPDLGNYLCSWYEENSLYLKNKVHELLTEMQEFKENHEKETNELKAILKEQRDKYEKEINSLNKSLEEFSENTVSEKRILHKRSRKHIDITGRHIKRLKTEDNQQDVMQPLAGPSIARTSCWSECLMHNDVKTANYLVQGNILPSNSELHKACVEFGRKSETFSNICGMICKQIMDTAEDVVDVWVSYYAEEWHLYGKMSIVFVVSMTDTAKCIKLKDYTYHLISKNSFSNESEEVLAMELSDETSDISSTRDTVEKMRKCISHYADDILERHSKISVVLPSLKKSVGYNSAKHTIIHEPCIVLYVPVKGYIPIDEDPFPLEIDGFKVDVLEGKFESYGGGPNEFHESLKIGLAIHANIRDNNTHLIGGTLGGFINHPVHNMCGLTCAHVVCSNEDMGCLNTQGFESDLSKPVFQPVTQESNPFGRVVMAVYNDGDEHTSGMEVALFNIQERHPKDGSFPLAFNNIEAGFDENNPMTYNSGNVCEASAISPRTEVYKYGMTTGITRGSFALQGAVVRKDRMEGRTGSFGYSLKNQLVVLQIGADPFAEAGDSGALVLMKGDQHDSIAIGIVEGGIKSRVFVTPICDILRAFGCSDIKMHTFNTVVKCPATSGDSVVGMDVSVPMDINDK